MHLSFFAPLQELYKSVIPINDFPISFYLGPFSVLWFNNTSTLACHFLSSPRNREKREGRINRGEEKEKEKETSGE